MPNSKLKPLVLLDIFKELTDEQHRLSVPQILDEFDNRGIEAERKGVYRDISTLMDYGFPIMQSQSGYYLAEHEFSSSEIRLLISALQAAYFITPAMTAQMQHKLAGQLSRYSAAELMAYTNIGALKCDNDEILKNIDLLNMAIASKRQVSFQYIKKDMRGKNVLQHNGDRYFVSPYAMIWMQDKYYLVCNYEGRDDMTHFRLDRIMHMQIELSPWRHFATVSEYVNKFDVADYAKKVFNMYGDNVERVLLKCDEAIVNDIFDRFGTDIIIRPQDEGKFLVTIQAAIGIGFISWASQFGEKLEIVYPAPLREQMKKRLEAALMNYINDEPHE